MKINILSSATFGAILYTTIAASALTIDTVAVGDPGNPNNPTVGQPYGGVSTVYAIGKYEVTLDQYTEFLNAVADTDAFGLYNTSVGAAFSIAGIARSGGSGSYSYAVIGNGARPVTYVSWFDAARFTNWMHNGQPNTGSQTAGTTEQGAYTLDGTTSGIVLKNAGAQWWIPSENEWYKAAYYQPFAAGGDADGYWLYPTGSNVIPNSRNGSASDPNSGNFIRDDSIANGFNGGYAVSNSTGLSTSQNYLTPVGAFTQADSFYGTFDQGGNVFEWNDAVFGSSRGRRGGSWLADEFDLRASTQYVAGPTLENSTLGFRVATLPEPTVAVMLFVGAGFLSARRKRPFQT